MSKPPMMLTINAIAAETGLAASFIRRLCWDNRIVYVRAGSKYLINYDRFIEYLNAGDAVAETEPQHGVIRPIELRAVGR